MKAWLALAKVVFTALGYALLAALAVLASALYHVTLPELRTSAARLVEDLFAGELRGRLEIGAFETLRPRRVVATDVRLIDPQGRTVITAKRIELVPDLPSIFSGSPRIASAHLTDGEVALIESGPEGLPSFIDSFEPDVPSTGPSLDPLVVRVDGIILQRVHVHGSLLGLHGLRAPDLAARGAMRIGGDVQIRIDHGSATLDRPFRFIGDIESISGTISTVHDEGIALRILGSKRGTPEQVVASVRYAAKDADPATVQTLHVEVDGQNITTPTVQEIGFDWMPELDVPVNGRFALHGPVDDFEIDAQLTSRGGAASLAGRVSAIEGYEVYVDAERLDVGQIIAGAPDIVVSGQAKLEATPLEASPRLRVSVTPFALGDFTVPAFALTGALEPDRLRVDSIEAAHRGARFTGKGHVGFRGQLALDFTALIDDIATDPALGRFVPGAHGRLHVDVRVASPDMSRGRLDLSGHADLTKFSYNGMVRADRLEIAGSAKGDPERPELRVTLRGRSIVVGDYALGDADLRVTGGPRAYKADGKIVREGQRNFVLAASARVEKGALTIEADPIELRVGEGTWRGALKGLRFAGNGDIGLELLRFANRAQRLEARGSLLERGDDEGSVLLQNFDLAAVAALVGERLPISEGFADAQVTLAGDLSRPLVQLQGALRQGTIGGVHDVNAVYFVIYENGSINLDGEVDLGERGVVQARGSGTIDVQHRDPVQALLLARYALSIGSQGLMLELVPQLRDAGIRGKLSGQLRVEGTLDAPELHGALQLDPIDLPDLAPLQAIFEVDHSGLDLRARGSFGDARGPLATMQARAELPIRSVLRDPRLLREALEHGKWELYFETLERRLDQLPEPLHAYAPYPLALKGNLELRRDGSGLRGSGAWSATWAGAVTGTECAIDVVPRGRGTFTLRDGALATEAFALIGPRRLASVEARLDLALEALIRGEPLPEPERFQARARVDVPNIEKVPFLCELGRGKVRADLELDGGRGATPILVAGANASFVPHTVQQGARRKTRVRGCADAPIELQLEANADARELRATAQSSGCHGGRSTLTAALPVDWNEGLRVVPRPSLDRPMSLKLALEGAQLAPLLDRIPGVRNADALARGELVATGTLRTPKLSGGVSMEAGRLYLVTMGQELSELTARITLLDDWAKIETLSVRSEDGSVEAAGGLGFEGLVPRRAQLAVRAREFPVLKEGSDVAWVTGSVVIDAQVLDDVLRAAARSHTLSVRLPDTENRALQPLEPHPDVVRSDAEEVAAAEPYAIELHFDGRSGVNAYRNDFNARIVTELAVSYRDPDLSVGGYMEFRGGTFETLAKPFVIERGSLRFDGTPSLNPEVLLVAVHRPEAAASSPVTVSVTGTLAKPEIAFSSDVCPGDSGAITYLIAGQCVADDPDLAQESESAQEAFAVGIAGSSVLTLLGTPPKVGGVTPRVGVESRGHGYDTRFKAGVASESLVPRFMRKLVRRVYIQGAVSTGSGEQLQLAESEPADSSFSRSLDFLIEMYFPHNIVGSGMFAADRWGVDVVWEP